MTLVANKEDLGGGMFGDFMVEEAYYTMGEGDTGVLELVVYNEYTDETLDTLATTEIDATLKRIATGLMGVEPNIEDWEIFGNEVVVALNSSRES